MKGESAVELSCHNSYDSPVDVCWTLSDGARMMAVDGPCRLQDGLTYSHLIVTRRASIWGYGEVQSSSTTYRCRAHHPAEGSHGENVWSVMFGWTAHVSMTLHTCLKFPKRTLNFKKVIFIH